MGVAGSGKSRIGKDSAARAGWAFTDGDDLHPPANKEKMARGEGLTDEDRQGWLESIRGEVARTVSSNGHRVIACSCLKRKYRDFVLDSEVVEPGRAVCVYLRVSEAVSRKRVVERKGHFAV